MKPEQQALIRKPKESLVASQLLADNQLYNFAGVRAYYTMFYIAEAFLWEKGLAFSSHLKKVFQHKKIYHEKAGLTQWQIKNR